MFVVVAVRTKPYLYHQAGHKSHVMSRNKFPLLKQRQNEIARQLEWPEEIERGRPTVVTVIGLINFRAGCKETVRKRSDLGWKGRFIKNG